MTFSYFTNHHDCFRPFDTYPDKAGDTTGPCEKWYKGADYFIFQVYFIIVFYGQFYCAHSQILILIMKTQKFHFFDHKGAVTDVKAGDRLKVRTLLHE